MRDCRVVVVGAGIGGLAAALMLACRGAAVTILEAAATPGGKVRQVNAGGALIDVGPTVLTMRHVFDRIAEECDIDLADHVRLQPLDVLARHAWGGGSRLDLFTDLERSILAIHDFAGPREADGYRRFSQRAKMIHDALDASFMRASRPNPLNLTWRLGLRHALAVMTVSPFATLWSEVAAHMRDPRLRQLFGRYATYCGGSPYESTAMLSLVAHVEREGVWIVEGGMHHLAVSLAKLCEAKGAVVRYGCRMSRIVQSGGKVTGVEIEGQGSITADAVIFNGDPDALARGLHGTGIKPAVAPLHPNDRSLSAVTFAMQARTRDFELLRHNVFFSDDYRTEFGDIRHHGRAPVHPTVYVCAQDRTDPGGIEPETDRMFCIVNAPAIDVASSATDVAACEDAMFSTFSRCGLSVTPQSTIVAHRPEDFACLFPGSAGALYGRAPHGWMAAFRRPGARTALRGLYLAGGAAHPGPGVPMAALSGRQAALAIVQDLASTRSFRPVDTPGGTWTPSAMMGSSQSSRSASSAASSRPTTRGASGATR